jgi:hypothetical protein
VTGPQPTRADHDWFCTVEGWRPVRDVVGRTGTRRVLYELELPNGRRLRTSVSHPVDRSEYAARLWEHILGDELEVNDEEFWACVKDGTLPTRGTPASQVESLPAQLVSLLIHTVGLSDDEVAAMTKEEAIARLNEFWATEA